MVAIMIEKKVKELLHSWQAYIFWNWCCVWVQQV